MWALVTSILLTVLAVMSTPVAIPYLIPAYLVVGVVFVVTFPVSYAFAWAIDQLAARSLRLGALVGLAFAILAGLAGGQAFGPTDPFIATLIFGAEGAAFSYLVLRLRGRLSRLQEPSARMTFSDVG
jgi:hypothetical protein